MSNSVRTAFLFLTFFCCYAEAGKVGVGSPAGLCLKTGNPTAPSAGQPGYAKEMADFFGFFVCDVREKMSLISKTC